MMIIVFRSVLTKEAGADYDSTSDVMFERASKWPGFVAMKSYESDEGERVTIVWWQDAESLRSWRDDAPHSAAQARGRERWYEWYEMDVAEIVRESRFSRNGPRERFAPPA